MRPTASQDHHSQPTSSLISALLAAGVQVGVGLLVTNGATYTGGTHSDPHAQLTVDAEATSIDEEFIIGS